MHSPPPNSMIRRYEDVTPAVLQVMERTKDPRLRETALIVKQGFKVLISQVYDSADPHLQSDVQFGVTEALTGDFIRHDDPNPDAPEVGTPWYSLDHTYVLEPGATAVPKPPIK